MAAELVDRMPILVAARRFFGMGDAHSQSLRYDNYVSMPKNFASIYLRSLSTFWGDVRREFQQRLSVVLHGNMGSYLLDAL
jgi:hypothetical protein